MKEITKAQEEILKVLWEIREGAVGDIVHRIAEPKPAYTTVATVIKVLEKKGYVVHKTFGKTHVYYPAVSKGEYIQYVMKDAIRGLFNGSVPQLVSSFVNSREISLHELEELKEMVEKEIKNKQQ